VDNNQTAARFYLTTPIYYVTAEPHIGTGYCTIATDVAARYHRLRGEDVLFATGVDEHAQKVLRAAEAEGTPIDEFLDRFAHVYQEAWSALHIDCDRFIRTSDADHKVAVQEVFARLLESGDIYKSEYEGWYCVPCETYFPEGDLVEGNCPDCGRKAEKLSQDAYFFRTSHYADALVKHIEENPGFILPESRRNEVLTFIKGGLRDACVSRKGTDLGIPVPGDEEHVVYVWFDALINYLTVAGYPDLDDATWPPDLQLMGKDILPRFHATIWPAMLMGLGLPLPRMLFATGWWLSDAGDKISKSKGNVVDLLQVAEQLGEISGCTQPVAVDAIRYFLLRDVQLGLDSSFSMMNLLNRFNGDLANDLGNILNRTLPLVDRFLGGTVPEPNDGSGAFAEDIKASLSAIDEAMQRVDFRATLESVWRLLAAGNKFIDEREPWTLHKEGKREELEAVLYDTVDLIRVIATLISPFMPAVSSEIWKQLGLEGRENLVAWDNCTPGAFPGGVKIQKGDPIFPRVDLKKVQADAGEQAADGKQDKRARKDKTGSKAVSTITYDEFSQLDLRVGKILDAENVPDADKLYKLTVDVGEEEPRTLVAGLAQEFSARELLDAYVVVVANLEPATIRGVDSNGMVLAAGEKKPIALVTLDRECEPGSKVR